ncbi:hypothetical protein BC829DRAFT_402589, partial [Chytridium lagenaria]
TGYQGDNLIYLDPHYMRGAVEVKDGSSYKIEDLSTYHCSTVRSINIESVDPSMVAAFYCKDELSFRHFLKEIHPLTEGKTPLFTIQEKLPDFLDAEVMSDNDSF